MTMKVEIVSRSCIKPSTPTPPHLKTFTFSLLDQLCTSVHANMTLFYPNTDSNSSIDSYSKNSHLLQRSLSQTLTRFYPLAGRLLLQDSSSIQCNDEGAYFIEARADAPLSHFLNRTGTSVFQRFLPSTDPQTVKASNGSLLLVQFTLFSCGGTALSISHSHKIVDLAALLIFLNSWTAETRGSSTPIVPDFCGASVLPPREIPTMAGASSLVGRDPVKFVAQRFVFENSKIADLRSLAAAAGAGLEFEPSRGELVLAVIWKCAVAAAGGFRPSVMFQGVDLRTRMRPRLPETAFGNFMWPYSVVVEEEREMEVDAMVKKMRESMEEFISNKANKFKGEEGLGTIMECLKERSEIMKRKGMKVLMCSSGRKFPLYETDFGWGKPAWMSSLNTVASNTVSLFATKSGGGVEAFVTLDEEEMAVFQKHPLLLSYASINPPITSTTLPPHHTSSNHLPTSKL